MKRLTTILLVLGLGPVARAADYSVDPTSDLVTILGALHAGDHVSFQDGVYNVDDTITITTTGTEADPVVIEPEPGAHPEIISKSGWTALYITQSAWISMDGLDIHGGDDWQSHGTTGIYIDEGQHLSFTNLALHELNGDGFRIENGSAITIDTVEIHTLLGHTGINLGCGGAECSLTKSTITHNYIHDLRNPDAASYEAGIYVGALSPENTITDNVITGVNWRGMSISSAQGSASNVVEGNAIWDIGSEEYGVSADGVWLGGGVTFRNNILFSIWGDGIHSYDDGNGSIDATVISHNTVVDTDSVAVRLSDWGPASNMVFANNAMANGFGYGLQLDGDNPLSQSNYVAGNVVTGAVELSADLVLDDLLSTGKILEGGGSHDFIDAADGNFYPRDGSAVINAGSNDGKANIPATDFNGFPREGDKPDAGAIEWQGTHPDDNPGWIITSAFKEFNVLEDPVYTSGGCCHKKSKGDDSGQAAIGVPALLALGLLRRRRAPATT